MNYGINNIKNEGDLLKEENSLIENTYKKQSNM